MKINQLNLLIGGKGGEGIDSVGTLFAKFAMSSGLFVHTAAEFQNVIQGYNNIYQVRVSEKPLYSHTNQYDLILALDQETTDLYLESLLPGGAIIYDPEITEIKKEVAGLFPIPLRQMAKETVGIELAKNLVALGAILALLKIL